MSSTHSQSAKPLLMPPAASSAPDSIDPNSPLRSVHTSNFPNLLNQIGASLLVTTYQSGKLIVVRADDTRLNTHFRVFSKPMGLVANRDRLLLGSRSHIWEFRNVPAAAAKIEPIGRHDACYLPRKVHTTGDIDIHEMAIGNDGLWFVNTRFSCLCTLDADYSFVPRWRPPFISSYAPEDRCHLNGLAMVDGVPKYVTALGTADQPGGWRENKASGGILMDVQTNEILVRNLSMPHSPRWYRDTLWVLESGQGTLSKVNLATGTLEPVVYLPGFTRGIDFYGSFAFIGLSQVRESASFSGIPLVDRLSERTCGVWVVNLDTAEIVAFLKFEDAVQEIFAVQILPGLRFPDVISEETEISARAYVLPDAALAEVAFSNVPVPESVRLFEAGNQARQQGQLDRAVAYYQQCLEQDPHQSIARYRLGITLVDLQQWQAGIEQLQQVIAERTDHAEAHNSLGVAYYQLQQVEQAIHHFERAVALSPAFELAQNNLRLLKKV